MMVDNDGPRELDGARVYLRTANDGSIVYGSVQRPGSGGDPVISGFAVCRYPDDEHFYLFGCDADWKILNDTRHESSTHAVRFAQQRYGVSPCEWMSRE